MLTMEEVVAWRIVNLLDAGYPLPDAEQLARSDVDLHEAVALLQRGCPPATAVAILT